MNLKERFTLIENLKKTLFDMSKGVKYSERSRYYIQCLIKLLKLNHEDLRIIGGFDYFDDYYFVVDIASDGLFNKREYFFISLDALKSISDSGTHTEMDEVISFMDFID
ncbi:hypothetical protein [Idiomarina piscisalsi]|uniref:Uncharacterized protein n=1 Tax=Idiomarina piscisalsi TaxID=1096243 RepID=A0A432YXG2_9GAMM|nr:hypothetical protein [Idiomarina piscisalsi]RUO68005.1 hypothetical protein CWI73_03875 [Idiomarina piscisalsi]